MNDIYNRCLNCGESLNQTKGKREKVFCDTTCRSNYWQKSERLEKKGLSVEQIVSAIRKSWVSKIVAENNKPENKAKIEAERNGVANDIKKEHKQPLTIAEMSDKPNKKDYKDSFDYYVALAAWKEHQTP